MSKKEVTWVALPDYAAALEEFTAQVDRYCGILEAGTRHYAARISDAGIRADLKKGCQLALDIKACLRPTQHILDRLRQLDIHPDASGERFR